MVDMERAVEFPPVDDFLSAGFLRSGKVGKIYVVKTVRIFRQKYSKFFTHLETSIFCYLHNFKLVTIKLDLMMHRKRIVCLLYLLERKVIVLRFPMFSQNHHPLS